MSADFDVVIVGAGPAGSWTAWHLARRGARVAILDPSHPREKPCGGGVTGRALALVAGGVDLATLPAVPIETARVADTGVGVASVPLVAAGLSPATHLVVASRRAFDRLLLEAAIGAGAVHEPVRARDVRIADDGVVVELARGALRSPLVIGADGATSLVRRRVARALTRAQLSIAAGVYAHDTTSTNVELRFSARPPGYLWSFPRTDHLAAGGCAPARETTTAALQASTRRWLRAAGLIRPESLEGERLEPYAWPIPTLDASDFAAERPAGPRWMLVGDAAGLVDPITREGIYFALASGEAAARAIAESSDPAAAYTRTLRAEFYPELARAARIKAWFFREPFLNLLVDALRQSPRVRAVMADLVGGTQPYATLKGRLLRTFEAGLAWRLFRLHVAEFPRTVPPGETVLP